MDYFDPAAGKARLAVVKYRATVLQKKGTLFLNPGASAGTSVLMMKILTLELYRWSWYIWC